MKKTSILILILAVFSLGAAAGAAFNTAYVYRTGAVDLGSTVIGVHEIVLNGKHYIVVENLRGLSICPQ